VKTCVLIPSYNEERKIGGIIGTLIRMGFTVYVVDDGSTDDTAAIAARAGAVVVKHKHNLGKGASIREGFGHILKRGFESVLVMDGDSQHDTADIDNFIKELDRSGADMVIGNRMRDTSKMPAARIYTNIFMSWLISMIVGQKIPDSQCGFRLIKADVLKKVRLKAHNYEIESELIVKAARSGFRIASVPIRTVYDDETSKISPFMDTLRFIGFLIKTLFGR